MLKLERNELYSNQSCDGDNDAHMEQIKVNGLETTDLMFENECLQYC